MAERGYYEPGGFSRTSLSVVIAMHAAALGALALMKGPEFVRPLFPPIITTFIPEPVDPPPNPPPPRADHPVRQPTFIDTVPPVVERETPGPTVRDQPVQPPPPPGPVGPTYAEARIDPPPLPVRVAADFDPRFAGEVQPPYPPSEERAQRGGRVRVRVTIGADGRVKSIERLSATSDTFWQATERHARARWRFRPATLDGRPIESSKTMNVFFRIEA